MCLSYSSLFVFGGTDLPFLGHKKEKQKQQQQQKEGHLFQRFLSPPLQEDQEIPPVSADLLQGKKGRDHANSEVLVISFKVFGIKILHHFLIPSSNPSW